MEGKILIADDETDIVVMLSQFFKVKVIGYLRQQMVLRH